MSVLVQTISQSHEVSADELQFLLACRAQGKVQFYLIDIREISEYSLQSIKGTDFLFPSSTLHQHLDELAKLQDRLLIFYCQRASRTFQLIPFLKRRGYTKIAHLNRGIVEYLGEKLKNAPLPHPIRTKEN
jgi:rhodanese-related sulfurtransferase